jgi:uncharacterized damage-inducible protein DinB
MKLRYGLAALAVLAVAPPGLSAQNALVSSMAEIHGITRTNILATARNVPEDLYDFAPTDEVRTMGALLGHIADAQYFFCSAAAGEAPPQRQSTEQTAATKAEIVAGLEASFAYCDGIYAGMTDAQAAESREFPIAPGPMTAASILTFNSTHNYEHYGNLVTYMRMNGIVPPSSQQ